MNPASIGNIVYNDLALAPCTAAASVELIKATGLNLHGLEVVMVGHSEIVGKPAAFMLMAEGATVTVCHHLTRSVAAHSRRADAVLVAVGQAEVPARRHGQARRGGHRHRHQPDHRSQRRDDRSSAMSIPKP